MKIFLRILIICFFIVGVYRIVLAGAELTTFNPQQTQDIEKIVHDYLLKNPQVIVESLQTFQEKQREQLTQETEKAIRSNAEQLLEVTSQTPVAGNIRGKVTLIEFFDYQCTHCKRIASTVKSLIQKNPELRVIFKELPIYPNSDYIAAASLASLNQNKYPAFHDALLHAKIPISQEEVLRIAKKVGLDISKLKTDMQAPAIETALKKNVDLANMLYISGTPTFIILSNTQNPDKMNVYLIPGAAPEAVMNKYIHEALAKTQQ